MIRPAAVAGSFYPSSPNQLTQELDQVLAGESTQKKYLGLVVPHAGYIYSGAIAAAGYRETRIPRTVLLLGPNHTGVGPRGSVFSGGAWRTPLGDVPIAEKLAASLVENCDLLESDVSAHRQEHSLEVQLPFLQRLRKDLQVVPITLGHGSLPEWQTLGRQIGAVLTGWEEEVLLIASSDMNHFDSAVYTEKVDHLAIARMEAFDPAGLFQVVRERNITMCGVIPAVVMLEAARCLGGSRCHLIDYGHSGRVNGDFSSVVGYATLGVE